jgi:hypothetical protein
MLQYTMECRGLCPLPVPLPFPTITGVWKWRIVGGGEDRRHIINTDVYSNAITLVLHVQGNAMVIVPHAALHRRKAFIVLHSAVRNITTATAHDTYIT